jgi:MFS family permease
VQIFTNTIELWMIYVYTLVGGTVGGFFGPASMSIVPRILPEKNLQAGNSLTQGSAQLIGFLGPALAGILIATIADEKLGVGIIIAIDALTFVVSLVTLWLMRTGGEIQISTSQPDFRAVFVSVREGIGYMLKDPALRLMFIIIAIANLSFGGPVVVGIPYLADTRFPEGAAAFGIIISGYAGGNLLGILLSGGLPKPGKKVLQILLVSLFAVFGLGIGALGWISVTWLAAVDMLVMGLLNGYISILLITGLQRNTPKEMLGRLMSLILFANMALMPISQALAGGILRWNAAILFVGAGALLAGLALYLVMPRASHNLSEQLLQS